VIIFHQSARINHILLFI